MSCCTLQEWRYDELLYSAGLEVGCSAKRIFFLSVRTEKKRNTGSFGSVSVFFPKE